MVVAAKKRKSEATSPSTSSNHEDINTAYGLLRRKCECGMQPSQMHTLVTDAIVDLKATKIPSSDTTWEQVINEFPPTGNIDVIKDPSVPSSNDGRCKIYYPVLHIDTIGDLATRTITDVITKWPVYRIDIPVWMYQGNLTQVRVILPAINRSMEKTNSTYLQPIPLGSSNPCEGINIWDIQRMTIDDQGPGDLMIFQKDAFKTGYFASKDDVPVKISGEEGVKGWGKMSDISMAESETHSVRRYNNRLHAEH